MIDLLCAFWEFCQKIVVAEISENITEMLQRYIGDSIRFLMFMFINFIVSP